jgi:hypothetical protein
MHVDLEVEVTADAASVAGLSHRSHALARPDALAAVDEGWPGQVGVEIGAVLAFAVDEEEVAVEHRIEASAQNAAVADGDQGRAAGGDDVEAFVGAPAAARGAELADGAAGAMGALDGEDVAVVGGAAVAVGDPGRRGGGAGREQKGEESERALQ